MRTRKPLAIPLAPIIWKLIVGDPVAIEDLEDIDCMYVQSLRSIRDIHLSGVTESNFHDVIPLENFEGTSCTGKVLIMNLTIITILAFGLELRQFTTRPTLRSSLQGTVQFETNQRGSNPEARIVPTRLTIIVTLI